MSYIAISLPNPPGGSGSSAVAATNGGTFVAGSCTDASGDGQAAYWDAARNIHILQALTASPTITAAFDVNGSGSLFVGVSSDLFGFWQPVTWAAPSYLPTRLQLLPGHNGGIAYACSGDGETVVGLSGTITSAPEGFSSSDPVVWINGVPTVLPPGGSGAVPQNISADGTVIVGIVLKTDGSWQQVSWTGGPSWSITNLGTQVGGFASQYFGMAASNGGSLLFGYTADAFGNNYASSWRGVSLTVLPGPIGGIGSILSGCDATGAFACGNSASGEAALWINGAGQLLPSIGGAAGSYAQSLSADATAIAGGGNNFSTAVLWLWQGAPIPGAEGPPTGGGGPVPIPIFPVRFLICQPTDWTLTWPTQVVYGLDHLAGMYVIGLADGVLIGPLLVSADGAVTLPFAASSITLGLSFTPQVQTTYLDAGTPTIQGRRKDILAVTARVKSSLGVQVGANQPDGAALDPPQNAPAWSGMQTIPTPPLAPSYTSPSGQPVTLPLTTDLRANVAADWEVPGQVAIAGTPGLPIYVLACVPELLEGDQIEQTYSKEAQGRRQQQKRGERLVPGMWMIGSDG